MNISDQFTYHKPTDREAQAMSDISDKAKEIALTCELALKPSAERTLALRKLQEFRMWINAAILFGELADNEVPVETDLSTTGPTGPIKELA